MRYAVIFVGKRRRFSFRVSAYNMQATKIVAKNGKITSPYFAIVPWVASADNVRAIFRRGYPMAHFTNITASGMNLGILYPYGHFKGFADVMGNLR